MKIQLSPHQVIVDGYPVAKTYSGFIRWIEKEKISINNFVNWPFMVGISSDLFTRKVKFWAD